MREKCDFLPQTALEEFCLTFIEKNIRCRMATTNKSKKPEPERVYVMKKRDCLKCGERFDSSWAGERVCKRCKSSGSWRSGSGFAAA